MEKFYSVCYQTEEGSAPIVTNKKIVDLESAIARAKKVAVDYRCPTYVMAPLYLVEAPAPEATVTEVK